ncbi:MULTISPECIES: type II toxin-antitoxin system HicB family antitoxin [Actinotignum]|uniref:type II toxin-antitoxin system HicB family antitoxin n=1 Tax=Actinotignum TaxID=1653174 RepID=UPI00254BD62B|nr:MULTISPECIES: hypothetical protein [Actinotignum]MDE1535864.1 hypothetical protein [Actinotignum schaalii]MDK7271632.1 hypothetical protein [Actinotignum schaalii]MDY5144252.1 hypothetical protein [Actinotignum timonense]
MSTYTARATREAGWWVVEVDEVPGLFTQSRKPEDIPDLVRDALALFPRSGTGSGQRPRSRYPSGLSQPAADMAKAGGPRSPGLLKTLALEQRMKWEPSGFILAATEPVPGR